MVGVITEHKENCYIYEIIFLLLYCIKNMDCVRSEIAFHAKILVPKEKRNTFIQEGVRY